jgi:hypothetical protein
MNRCWQCFSCSSRRTTSDRAHPITVFLVVSFTLHISLYWKKSFVPPFSQCMQRHPINNISKIELCSPFICTQHLFRIANSCYPYAWASKPHVPPPPAPKDMRTKPCIHITLNGVNLTPQETTKSTRDQIIYVGTLVNYLTYNDPIKPS